MFAGTAVWGHKLETLLHTLSSLKVNILYYICMHLCVCVCILDNTHNVQLSVLGKSQVPGSYINTRSLIEWNYHPTTIIF